MSDGAARSLASRPGCAAPGLIAGIDEAGRGSLAGPVIAAAILLHPDRPMIPGLDDSKRLSPRRRQELAEVILATALDCAVGRAEASEIDRLNILRASLLAMQRAFDGLRVRPEWVRVDGSHFPAVGCPGEAIAHGDAIFPEIMAASIVAKVMRDRELAILEVLEPGYRFATHKGYPTAAHREELDRRGASPHHRVTFSPLRKSAR